MAKFRKVDPRIWNDEKFCDLSERGQLVFLFLMTHPHQTSLGAFRATVAGLAAERGIPEKAFREAFGEALLKGMIRVDEKASFIWLPNFLKYNKPESPNVVKSWENACDLIPECRHKVQLLQQLKGFAEGLGKAFAKAFPASLSRAADHPSPNQEQEQEPEQEQEQEPEKASVETKAKPPSISEPSMLAFPTDGDEKVWHLTMSAVRTLSDSFPNLDILAECRKARGWLESNPTRLKTPRGMKKFLFSWMDRAQNSKKSGPPGMFGDPDDPRGNMAAGHKFLGSSNA